MGVDGRGIMIGIRSLLLRYVIVLTELERMVCVLTYAL
jgi:hypothetical protein